MKIKSLLIIIVAMLSTLTCVARDQYSTDVTVLPQGAANVVSTHFQKVGVSHIKIDKGLFGVDGYDVILNDGTEIEFDSKGVLKEVECSRTGNVPPALMPKSVVDYVSRTYPNQNIVKYEVKRGGYEVELQSGVDLVFNKQGQFIRIDD